MSSEENHYACASGLHEFDQDKYVEFFINRPVV
jgi:hypothetical protein